MAASSSSQQPHFTFPQKSSTAKQQQHSSKSCSNIFLKSVLVMFVLVVIPLFPSQAPDFISPSVVTQFWELFHLLFIGIVVCYGLFCKRSSTKTYDETHSRFDSSDVYASGMSNVVSIFDNGVENYCEFDEKRVIPNWDSQFLHREGREQERFELVEGGRSRSFSNENGAHDDKRVIPNWDSQFLHYEYRAQERSSLDEGEKSRSFSVVDGVENTEVFNEREVGQVWNSQYFFGESMVVVANGNYGVEKVSHIDHKPLGLPVRSLRYRVNAENSESIVEDTADSGFFSGSVGYEVREEKIRGMAPINLRRKIEEASGPRQVSWRSRSQRREVEGVDTVRPPSHSRPHSVGQLEFGYLKSRSFSKPVSSRTSPTSVSPSITSPSSSCSSENGSGKMPHSDPHYAFEGISISASQQTGASFGESAVLTSTVKQSSNELCSKMNVLLRDDYDEDEKKMKIMYPSSSEACHVQGHPHYKSHSAGETEFEHQEPWSFWNRVRAQIVPNSSSPRTISPISSVSPEMPNSRKQDPERLKNVKPPPIQVGQPTARSANDAAAFVASKTRRSTVGSTSDFDMLRTSKDKLKDVAPVNDEATYHTSKSRAFSNGSSSEITMQESSKDKLKHARKDLKQDSSYTQKQSVNPLVSDLKQPVPAKISSMGKSVRTFRSRRSYIDRSKRKVDCPKEGGDVNEVSFNQFDTVSSLKSINREAESKPPVDSRKGILDSSGPIPSSAFFESEPEAKQHFVNTDIVESKKNSESKGNSESVLTNSHMSSDEEAGFDLADDVDLGSEVDRKAGEFIAKFREQIRLQKIESFRRSSA